MHAHTQTHIEKENLLNSKNKTKIQMFAHYQQSKQIIFFLLPIGKFTHDMNLLTSLNLITVTLVQFFSFFFDLAINIMWCKCYENHSFVNDCNFHSFIFLFVIRFVVKLLSLEIVSSIFLFHLIIMAE